MTAGPSQRSTAGGKEEKELRHLTWMEVEGCINREVAEVHTFCTLQQIASAV